MKIKFFKPMALLLFVIGSFSCDKEPKLSSEKEILSFQINGVEGQIAKTEWGSFVDVFLPLGTDLSALTPIITVSDKATVLPPSGGTQDFSDFIVKHYVVTAEDGSSRTFYVGIGLISSDGLETRATKGAVSITIGSDGNGTTSPKVGTHNVDDSKLFSIKATPNNGY